MYTKIPLFVDDGQEVLFPYRNSYSVGIVVNAMGLSARIVNQEKRIDTWFRIDELRIDSFKD